ncbi:DUF2993 domain-containing protein [Rubrobacter indicoceani]|uniref:LmeA family phospholipid-binding protein n=1 Tax=Rubrobacter indicoceani TaxID=2051957 RepID=UPI000E5B820E|nr:DUF2993 domain-containing protein [Rubrobacter indicoceani]
MPPPRPDREIRTGQDWRRPRTGSRRERRKKFGGGAVPRFLLFGAAFLLGLGAVVLLIGVIGSYTFLPGLVSERISAGIREDLDLERNPEVSVASDPPPNILRGRFSGGTVSIGDDRLFGFRVRRIDVALDPFDVDVPASLRQPEPVYEEAFSGTFRAVVSNEEVARVAREEAGEENVRLEGGQLVLGREPQLLGDTTLPVEVRGDLTLQTPESLAYTPRSVSVAGVSLPEEITRDILSGTELTFPVEDVGDGTVLRRAEVVGDRLVLSGDLGEPQGGPVQR